MPCSLEFGLRKLFPSNGIQGVRFRASHISYGYISLFYNILGGSKRVRPTFFGPWLAYLKGRTLLDAVSVAVELGEWHFHWFWQVGS